MRRAEFFPSVFNDFFKPWETLFDTNGGSLLANLSPINIPAVNVVENKNNYEISVAAPGMKKDDFRIDVEGNVLTISAEAEEKKEEKEGKYTRKEYNYSSFSRNFTLPDWVNKDKIDATYENGVLKLELPKTEEAKKIAPRHISVK
ncbi:MAG: Hsp20/alpha crystallin family protein [Bacteroidota bacterium]|nr:Hsp20/alpha crystallin family protein [Bacteroidota bacterium]MDP4215595.1 Hsp20/alpha crystallin family protein [Bacteroidota bacterium]MDP4246156.1 Hsp20/alpha crystallin family protein [Bacteroidota bacterium]MDP4255544.1 Hsp20/alpha crystallin family protein [Bacteroidota bacterium]MDP4259543.1 Hsp20/alpha crystallin family protein [Bacteroidota bacterium]